jgi:sensor domain CHASE-containing protein
VLVGIAIGIRHPILQGFALLEQDIMHKQLAHVADAFVQQLEKLDSSAKAEAVWTEMYTYMLERNPRFYQETYPFEGLATSSVDVIGVLDHDGNPLHLDWVDRKSRQLKPLENSIRADLLREGQLTSFPADKDPALGRSRNLAVVQTISKPLLVATRPILTSNAEGPRQGTFLMGVFIDREFLTQLEKQSDLRLQLTALPSVHPTYNVSKTASDSLSIIQISPNIPVVNHQSFTY